MSSGKTSRPTLKDIGRPFKVALVSERKQVGITGCENKTIVIFSREGGKTKTIEHKFKEPTGIAFLPVLEVVAVCDSSDCALVLFAKNGDGVLVVNCPRRYRQFMCDLFKESRVPFSLHQAPACYTKWK